jgi:hypothetical protein
MQTTQHLLMIRPSRFECNKQTTSSNAFQKQSSDPIAAQAAALQEFDAYVEQLRAAGVAVMVEQDRAELHTPDSIFPNNWVSFHHDGSVVLYPMEALNRRLERNECILKRIKEHFDIKQIHDLSSFELKEQFLEGTGSLVLDREHRIAYVCRSSRSNPAVMSAFSALLDYTAFWFNAQDANGRDIYHTNVMMSVGKVLAVVCLESIRDQGERMALVELLRKTGKKILDISLSQTLAFAGNVLEVSNLAGEPVLAMSERAWNSLDTQQKVLLTRHVRPVIAQLDTIETFGGGGARCMIAEIHLPLRQEGI